MNEFFVYLFVLIVTLAFAVLTVKGANQHRFWAVLNVLLFSLVYFELFLVVTMGGLIKISDPFLHGFLMGTVVIWGLVTSLAARRIVERMQRHD